MTPEPSPILNAGHKEGGGSENKKKKGCKIKINEMCTHTNPSRPESKGREASCGAELYFVHKALDLKIIN